MMFGGGWPYLTRERAIVLMLALIGLGWLLLQLGQANPALVSTWNGQNAAFGAADAAQAVGQNGLVGVARPQAGQGLAGALKPGGNPLGDANTIMTQGYGSGTHAPAAVWGAVDLAIAKPGSRRADVQSTLGKPVYATHSGVVKVTPNSWPAGNHVWVANDQYRSGYSHLLDFAVSDGQHVERGELIGHIGSTGMSSGPHLDYQVWQMQGGQWVNMNPLDFGVLEGLTQ